MADVLLTDDDPAIRRSLALALRSFGHRIHLACDGLEALAHLRSGQPADVVVLDVMMPRLDGLAACRRIRADLDTPILMLTALGDPTDIVVGLEAGADDYVTKPVDPRVLEARLRALLRRSPAPAANPILRIGDIAIDEAALTATRRGEPLRLTPVEMRLLLHLAHHPNRVWSRSQLLDHVWDYGYEGDSRLVDAAVQRLRAKTEDDTRHPTLIRTVRGFGYRLDTE